MHVWSNFSLRWMVPGTEECAPVNGRSVNGIPVLTIHTGQACIRIGSCVQSSNSTLAPWHTLHALLLCLSCHSTRHHSPNLKYSWRFFGLKKPYPKALHLGPWCRTWGSELQLNFKYCGYASASAIWAQKQVISAIDSEIKFLFSYSYL